MKKTLYTLLILLLAVNSIIAQELYEIPAGAKSRLSSFENPNGIKGAGGKTNQSAKGNAFEVLEAAGSKTLLNILGEGKIQRIWLTINQDPVKLRSIRLQMYWDNDNKPAVDVPLGDFFVYNLGKPVAFESAFFTSGEGRSFVCYIPMPFKKAARMVLLNEGLQPVKLFYDVDFLLQPISDDALYFHAYWTRQKEGKPGDDFLVLPTINGTGRYLGMSVGLHTDPAYGTTWWGEGEVKMYLDGDTKYPTIVGTGSEDYIGSAWGLGKFINQYQGCTVANDSAGEYNFYRWHVPDAIYFNDNIKVTLQQIGGGGTKLVRELFQKGVNLVPVTIDAEKGFVRLLDMKDPPSLSDPDFPGGWVNFYRVDDYSAVSYFYLNKTSSSLPALPAVSFRTSK